MDDIQKWCNTLDREQIKSNGVDTALWVSKNDGPVVLFVHGINGSHYGLAELAREMPNSKVVLVDLPGHGESSIPEWLDIDNLRRWFQGVYSYVASQSGEGVIKDVVAHSFGCYAITNTSSRTILICPVPTARPIYYMLSQASYCLFKPYLATKIYNWTPFSAERGYLLLTHRTQANWRLIHWIAEHDHLVSSEKREYQAKLSRLIQRKDIFHGVDCERVIMGKYDAMAREQTKRNMGEVFREAKISVVSTGHLAPIEEPKQIASIIKSQDRLSGIN
jgi:pimeloyl-ACP methyl ester carboxylesterase